MVFCERAMNHMPKGLVIENDVYNYAGNTHQSIWCNITKSLQEFQIWGDEANLLFDKNSIVITIFAIFTPKHITKTLYARYVFIKLDIYEGGTKKTVKVPFNGPHVKKTNNRSTASGKSN